MRQTLESGSLQIALESHDTHHAATFDGRIDERAMLLDFAGRVEGTVSLDLERVTFINSVGVREWIKMMRSLDGRGVALRIERCSEPMVHQMNMIVEAKGTATVTSFYAPYQCDACGYEGSMCIDVESHAELLSTMRAPEQSCPECAGTMELIEIPERYFLFLEDQ